jgi:hypothetical protein
LSVTLVRGCRRLRCFGSFLGDFLGITEDDEIRTWNVTPLPGVWSFWNLSSGTRKSTLLRLGSDFLDSPVSSPLPSSDPRRLHPLFSQLNHSPLSAPYTLRHRSDEQPETLVPPFCTFAPLKTDFFLVFRLNSVGIKIACKTRTNWRRNKRRTKLKNYSIM